MTARFVAIATACLLAGQAAATDVSGHWSCNDARRYTGSSASASELRSFRMAVYPNGTVEGQGLVRAVNGAEHGYVFQGTWQVTGRSFDFQVMSSIGGGVPMNFSSKILDAGRMAHSWIEPVSGNRVDTNCARTG